MSYLCDKEEVLLPRCASCCLASYCLFILILSVKTTSSVLTFTFDSVALPQASSICLKNYNPDLMSSKMVNVKSFSARSPFTDSQPCSLTLFFPLFQIVFSTSCTFPACVWSLLCLLLINHCQSADYTSSY